MIHLELSEEAAVRLQEVLGSYLDDLEREIGLTESVEVRADLKRTRELLRALLDRLPVREGV